MSSDWGAPGHGYICPGRLASMRTAGLPTPAPFRITSPPLFTVLLTLRVHRSLTPSVKGRGASRFRRSTLPSSIGVGFHHAEVIPPLFNAPLSVGRISTDVRALIDYVSRFVR